MSDFGLSGVLMQLHSDTASPEDVEELGVYVWLNYASDNLRQLFDVALPIVSIEVGFLKHEAYVGDVECL